MCCAPPPDAAWYAGQAHQHAADGAVAADEVAHAALERRVDHRAIDRVQHDDGVVGHAQGAGRIDPDAIPARATQLRVDLGRAFCNGPAPSAQVGAAPPALLVEKNTGSISAKSFSSRMRCMSTEPTIPRQPTRPTA
ncbi:hypothetical protein G6F31_020047 [Rhizopus arrhizus]|nr:hypothetical protein G6F31_020047 [Rhizopus arrhizus]